MAKNQDRVTTDWLAAPAGTTFGIVAADAARARFLVLESTAGADLPTLAPLVEINTFYEPEARLRDTELFANTRPGLRREGPTGPRHAVSDRREGHRRETEQRFAAKIAEAADRLWREHGATRIVVVASPPMLGILRPALEEAMGSNAPWSLRDLSRDLTGLAAPALHDALAQDGLVPPRGRLNARQSAPGVPA